MQMKDEILKYIRLLCFQLHSLHSHSLTSHISFIYPQLQALIFNFKY